MYINVIFMMHWHQVQFQHKNSPIWGWIDTFSWENETPKQWHHTINLFHYLTVGNKHVYMTSQPLKSLPVFVCAASWTAVTSPWLRRWRQRSSPSNQSSAASATTKEPKSCWRIWTSRDFFLILNELVVLNVFRKWTQPGTLMRRFSPWWKNISVWRTKWCCEKTGSTRRCPLCVGVHLKVCTTHEQNT